MFKLANQMAFRTGFWTPILAVLVISTILFFRLYVIIFQLRAHLQYRSFFFRMFLTQSLMEVVFVYFYVFIQMVTKDFIFGDEIVLDIKILPHLLYFWTFYYFNYSQMWNATMISINRYVVVCHPMSTVAKFYKKHALPLSLLNLVMPLLLCSRLFFQPPMYYARNQDGVVTLVSDFPTVNSNSIQSLIMSSSACLISGLCYTRIIRRLLETRKDGLDTHRREISVSIVGFFVFIALCIMTGFFVLLNVYSATQNEIALVTTRTYYLHFSLILTFVNSWMLFLTDKNLGRRAIFCKLKKGAIGVKGNTSKS